MKALNNITNSRDLAHQKALLLKQLHRQEHAIDGDMQRINRHWHIFKQVGSTVSNLALAFMPKINTFSIGASLIRRIMKRRK